MTDPPTPSRRRFLTASAGGVALSALAGCADDAGREPADGTDSESGDANGSESGDADGSDSDSDTEDADLDLREANIVDVAFEPIDDGYAFDVTLHHDDDGEDGYANWWQVERLDGTRLGRRELLHAHSEQPFTRSATMAIPDDATCVVVRGHDQTHGYGGVAAVVDLDAEAVRRVDQGADPRSFDEADCP
ncbi:MAG: twin-arginine translocation signal domain-containing protein [Halobacteriota archaeon]